MKIQFKVIAARLGYEEEDVIKTWVFNEGNYTFLILNHNYGDDISLKMSDKMPVDFHKVNDVDNFILNNKRHIKFKPLDMSLPRELDIICTTKEEYKNATVYRTPTANIFKITTVNDAMFFINGFYYLIMETVNKPGYYLTFANDYIVLTDNEYNGEDKLPGITLAKFPLPKEKLKNVLTFDNPENIDSFFHKAMNMYAYNNRDLPKEHADVYIVLRYIMSNIDRLVSNSQLLAFNHEPVLLFKAEKYNDINEILSRKDKNFPDININFAYPSFSYLDEYYDRLKGDVK